jgi:hypothetical protein
MLRIRVLLVNQTRGSSSELSARAQGSVTELLHWFCREEAITEVFDRRCEQLAKCLATENDLHI